MGIVNISDMKRETEGEKNFTPVTKSSIFQKTEQTTTYHFPQILVTVFQFLRPQYDQRKAADLPINRFK
ncbi:hypothetical protein [Clostridium sp.]|uniref:hypothetical protein n=1 Tax=Clostridium sp. TaxID=1506 RepID=UPI00307A6D4B